MKKLDKFLEFLFHSRIGKWISVLVISMIPFIGGGCFLFETLDCMCGGDLNSSNNYYGNTSCWGELDQACNELLSCGGSCDNSILTAVFGDGCIKQNGNCTTVYNCNPSAIFTGDCGSGGKDGYCSCGGIAVDCKGRVLDKNGNIIYDTPTTSNNGCGGNNNNNGCNDNNNNNNGCNDNNNDGCGGNNSGGGNSTYVPPATYQVTVQYWTKQGKITAISDTVLTLYKKPSNISFAVPDNYKNYFNVKGVYTDNEFDEDEKFADAYGNVVDDDVKMSDGKVLYVLLEEKYYNNTRTFNFVVEVDGSLGYPSGFHYTAPSPVSVKVGQIVNTFPQTPSVPGFDFDGWYLKETGGRRKILLTNNQEFHLYTLGLNPDSTSHEVVAKFSTQALEVTIMDWDGPDT